MFSARQNVDCQDAASMTAETMDGLSVEESDAIDCSAHQGFEGWWHGNSQLPHVTHTHTHTHTERERERER